MEFAFYNMTSIRGFTSMLTVVCKNTTMLWVFITEFKLSPVHIICLILTILKNEQHSLKCVRVDEDGALVISTEVTNLLVDDFIIYMENTGGDASWLNGNN